MLIIALLSLTRVNHLALDQKHREAMFDDIWRKPASRFEGRKASHRLAQPMISDLHHAIATHPKTIPDAADEKNIAAALASHGVGPHSYNYYRSTCRHRVCETVIILNKFLDSYRAEKVFNAVRLSSDQLCPAQMCMATVTMAAANYKNDGTSLLMYFIPRNKTS